jgi:hypothetical protein
MKRAVSVRVPRPYLLDVTFDDGTSRQIDMEPELWGSMFEPLRDPVLFRQVKIDPELETVAWPNGADVSPEFLIYGDQNPYQAFLDDLPASTSAQPST